MKDILKHLLIFICVILIAIGLMRYNLKHNTRSTERDIKQLQEIKRKEYEKTIQHIDTVHIDSVQKLLTNPGLY